MAKRVVTDARTGRAVYAGAVYRRVADGGWSVTYDEETRRCAASQVPLQVARQVAARIDTLLER